MRPDRPRPRPPLTTTAAAPRVERGAARPSRRFRPDRPSPPAWVRVMRPTQWSKNLACFAGLIFSGRLFCPACEAGAVAGFAAFCLLASAAYVLNDVLDRDRDRLNPRTARRPVASGELSVRAASLLGMLLLAAATALASALGPACLLTLACYAGLNVLYSARLKRVAIVDVMCIAVGFVLRVMFGVYAVGDLPTPWVVLCMFFLALLLGFAKRRAELSAPGRVDGAPSARPVLDKYSVPYLDVLTVMSAAMAVICYALFTVASHRNPTLVVTVVPVVYCVMRYLLQVMLAGRGESPDRVLVGDRRLWAGVALWLALYVAVLYGDVRLFADDTISGPAGVATPIQRGP